MKLCFPIEKDDGLKSTVHNHFGSTPMFIVVDTDTNDCKTIHNNNQHHAHGMCQPISALGGTKVDAVVLGGIGAGAIQKLRAMGVEVYQSEAETIEDNIALFLANKLNIMNTTCAGHSHGGGHGCGH